MRRILLLASLAWCASWGAYAALDVTSFSYSPQSPTLGETVMLTFDCTYADMTEMANATYEINGVALTSGTAISNDANSGTITFSFAIPLDAIGSLPVTVNGGQVGFLDVVAANPTMTVDIDTSTPTSGQDVVLTPTIIGYTPVAGEHFITQIYLNNNESLVLLHSFASPATAPTITVTLPVGEFATAIFVILPVNDIHDTIAVRVDANVSEDRSDPGLDPDVRGTITAQIATAERFYRVQSGNINNRLSMLRSAEARENRANDFNLSLNLPSAARKNRDRGEEDRPGETAPGSIRIGDLARAKGEGALASVPPPAVASRLSFWSDGAVSFGSLDEDGEVDLDHTTFGLTFGLDYAFGDRIAAGLALGYSHDKTDVGNKGSEVKADGYTAALYGSYLLRPNVFLEGMLGYTAIGYDNRRRTDEGFVKGDRDGDQYFASLAMGYEYRKNGFALTPFTRFETAVTRLDRYSERGNRLALRYDKQDVEMYTGSLGVTASRTFAFAWGDLTPSAGAEYAYNFKDESRAAMAYTDTLPILGTPYSFTATSVARHTFTATGGLDARFNRNFSLGARYRGSFASERRNHYFSLQAAWSW